MKILKVENILQTSGTVDYKGLNIDLFVPGKIQYPKNLSTDNFVYLYTEEDDYKSNTNIQEVTENEFNEFVESQQTTPEKTELELLREELKATQDAVDFLLSIGGM